MEFELSMVIGKDWKSGSIASVSIIGKEKTKTSGIKDNTRIIEIATVCSSPDKDITTIWHNNTYRYHSKVKELIDAAYASLHQITLDGRIQDPKLPPLYELAVSSMNYFFLRGVTGKETLPQYMNEELSMFFQELSKMIHSGDPSVFLIKEIFAREIREGEYIGDSRKFYVVVKDYFLSHEEMEIFEDDINTICNFYEDIVCEIEKEQEVER